MLPNQGIDRSEVEFQIVVLAIEIISPADDVEAVVMFLHLRCRIGIDPPDAFQQTTKKLMPVRAGLGLRIQPRHVDHQWFGGKLTHG